MSHAAYARRTRRRSPLPVLATLAAIAAAGWAVVTRPHGDGPVRPSLQSPAAPEAAPRASVAWMLDPVPALGSGTSTFARGAPPALAFRAPAGSGPGAAPAAVLADAAMPIATTPAGPPARVASAEPTIPAALAALVPLPVARPPEFQRPQVGPPARVAGRRPLPRTRDVFRAAVAEEPSFLERLFGSGRPEAPRQALAYADPQNLMKKINTRKT